MTRVYLVDILTQATSNGAILTENVFIASSREGALGYLMKDNLCDGQQPWSLQVYGVDVDDTKSRVHDMMNFGADLKRYACVNDALNAGSGQSHPVPLAAADAEERNRQARKALAGYEAEGHFAGLDVLSVHDFTPDETDGLRALVSVCPVGSDEPAHDVVFRVSFFSACPEVCGVSCCVDGAEPDVAPSEAAPASARPSLSYERLQKALAVLEGHDFDDHEFQASSGFQYIVGENTMTAPVFLLPKGADGDSLRADFTVRFAPGSSDITDAECVLDGVPVGCSALPPRPVVTTLRPWI